MPQPVTVPSPLGDLVLRTEREDDRDFRLELFCGSRAPEWYVIQWEPNLFDQIMRQQFQAQTMSYAQQFPHARFDIIELDGRPIGRIVVDRPEDQVHLVDLAIVHDRRGQGLGEAILRALMAEAEAAELPVRLEVASSNDPTMRLYQRLGFRQCAETPLYIQMEWRGGG